MRTIFDEVTGKNIVSPFYGTQRKFSAASDGGRILKIVRTYGEVNTGQ